MATGYGCGKCDARFDERVAVCPKCGHVFAGPGKTFPIMLGARDESARYGPVPGRIPWSIVEPGRQRAMKNHSQTLERLAERGGLSPGELMCALEDRSLYPMPTREESGAYLRALLEPKRAEDMSSESNLNDWTRDMLIEEVVLLRMQRHGLLAERAALREAAAELAAWAQTEDSPCCVCGFSHEDGHHDTCPVTHARALLAPKKEPNPCECKSTTYDLNGVEFCSECDSPLIARTDTKS